MSDSGTSAQPRPRIQSLSDMVFGLALSVGSISLVTKPPTNEAQLYQDIAVFGFNFLILILAWMRYTRIMSVLPLEDRRIILLNAILLFAVSLEPFLFNTLEQPTTTGPFLEPVSNVYGADLGVMMLIQGLFTSVLADEERKLVPKELIREFYYEAIGMFAAGAIFIGTIVVPVTMIGLFNFPLKFELWIIPSLVASTRRRTKNIIKEIQKHRKGRNNVVAAKKG